MVDANVVADVWLIVGRVRNLVPERGAGVAREKKKLVAAGYTTDENDIRAGPQM